MAKPESPRSSPESNLARRRATHPEASARVDPATRHALRFHSFSDDKATSSSNQHVYGPISSSRQGSSSASAAWPSSDRKRKERDDDEQGEEGRPAEDSSTSCDRSRILSPRLTGERAKADRSETITHDVKRLREFCAESMAVSTWLVSTSVVRVSSLSCSQRRPRPAPGWPRGRDGQVRLGLGPFACLDLSSR